MFQSVSAFAPISNPSNWSETRLMTAGNAW
jgi:S-formylglutathione hydrolase FrmB